MGPNSAVGVGSVRVMTLSSFSEAYVMAASSANPSERRLANIYPASVSSGTIGCLMGAPNKGVCRSKSSRFSVCFTGRKGSCSVSMTFNSFKRGPVNVRSGVASVSVLHVTRGLGYGMIIPVR